MSRVLTINPPYKGLSVAVNVLKHVGPGKPNDNDDVRLIQRLLQLCATGSEFAADIGLPNLTGKFDAATGFWIFRFQEVDRRKNPTQVIDGIVSPATGGRYNAASPWTIISMNEFAQRKNPAGLSALIAAGGKA